MLDECWLKLKKELEKKKNIEKLDIKGKINQMLVSVK